jgi:hypothetical protein
MAHRKSLHHLYYSSQADPTDDMLRANNLRSKSTYNINTFPGNTNKFGSRWTLAQTESAESRQEKQEKLHNTYYNNMVCYINNKNSDTDSTMSAIKARKLGKSRESLYSAMLKEPIKESKEEEECAACRQCDTCCDSCCCSFWTWVLMFVFLIVGFLGGVVVGAIVQRNGYLREMGVVLPGDFYNDYPGQGQDYVGQDASSGRTRIILPGEDGGQPRVLVPGDVGNDPKCVVRMTNLNESSGSCALCSRTRLLNVTGAGYADCSGLYTISNLTSIWDSKRVVFERIAGGWRPMDKRYIYWNAHFFGENFYGWSIGDAQSLVESGPFHSQGRVGASNQPWQGTWRANVTVELTSCHIPREDKRSIRWNTKKMDELQRIRERERELNILRNIQLNRQNGEGGKY